MQTIKQLKNYLKEAAITIRSEKAKRKEATNGYVPGLLSLRTQYRNNHIAYCIFRNTPIEKIEHNTDYIKANWYYISQIISSIVKEEKEQGVGNAA